MTPILAWAISGDVDVERMSSTLKRAVLRTAPWLTGRLELNKKQYDVLVPTASEVHVEPFRTTTFEAPNQALHELLPNYVPCGSTIPSVKRFNPRKIPSLTPLAAFTKSAYQCAKQGENLMHLHFVKAQDLTLMCVAWQHVVLDATALKLIVTEWERLLAHKTDTSVLSDSDMAVGSRNGPNLNVLSRTLNMNKVVSLPGWSMITRWGALKLLLRSKLNNMWYPRSFGTAYLPPKLVEKLVLRARSNAGPGATLSKNDIIASWFYKVTCGIYPSDTVTTLSRAVNLRGRHSLISPDVSGNVLGLAVMPSIQSRALEHMPLEDLALASRQSVGEFRDPTFVSRFLAFRASCSNANLIAVPGAEPSNQRCLITSFVNLGLSRPDFGPDVSVDKAVQLTMDLVVIRIIDDSKGGWSFHANLPHIAWDAVDRDMEREMENTDAIGPLQAT